MTQIASWPTVLADLNTTRKPNDPNGTDTWVDVTNKLVEFSCSRGRSDELADVQAGKMQWKLLNSDARFDPDNAAGTYYGNLRPNRQGRIRAQWADNLLTPLAASFTGGAGAWSPFQCTVAATTLLAPFLGQATALTMTASGAGFTGMTLSTPGVECPPVTVGQSYTMRARVGVPSQSGRTVDIQVNWLDSGLATLSSAFGPSTPLTTGGDYVDLTVTGTAPASAVKAQLVVSVRMASSVSGETVRMVCPGLFLGTPAAWSPSGGQNLLDANTASIETDATGWVQDYNAANIVRSTAVALEGAAALAFQLRIAPPDLAQVVTAATYPATAGQTYTGSASFQPATTVRNTYVRLAFTDINGTAFAYSTPSPVTEVGSQWTRNTATAVAPAGTYGVKLMLSVQAITTTAEVHYADAMGIYVGSSGVWQRPQALTALGYGYEEAGFPQSYDLTGTRAWCEPSFIDAIGPLGQIGLLDVYNNEVISDAPLALYPLSEAAGSTTAGSISGFRQDPLALTVLDATSISTFGAAKIAGLDSLTAWTSAGGVTFTLPTTADPLPLATGASVEFWFSSTASGGLANPTLQQSLYYGRTFYCDLRDQGVFGQLRAFAGSAGGGGVAQVNTTVALNDGKPHHVVLTLGTDQKTLTLYVDGVLVGSNTAASVIAAAAVNPGFPGPPPSNGNPPVNNATVGAGAGGTRTHAAPGTYQYLATYSAPLSLSRIAQHFLAGTNGFSGDTTGGRITRILNWISWLTGLRSIDTTSMGELDAPLQAATGLGGTTALAALQKTASAANSLLDIDGAGRVRYRSRDYKVLQPTPVVVFGEFQAQGEVPYVAGIGFDSRPDYLYSTVEVNQDNGITVRHADATAVLELFGRTLTKSTSVSDYGLVIDLADQALNDYKAGLQRCATLTVEPSSIPAIWPAVLALDYGTRVRVNRRLPNGGTSVTKTVDCFVESIAHKVTKGKWQVTYTLSPAPAVQGFILDDPTYGVLDSAYLISA